MASLGFIAAFLGLGITAGGDVSDLDEALQVSEAPAAKLTL